MKWYSAQVHRMRGVDAVSGDIDGPHGEGRKKGQKGISAVRALRWHSCGGHWGPCGGAVIVIAGMAQRGQPLDVGISVTPSRISAGPNGGRVKVIMVVWYSGDRCGPLR